MLLGISEEDRDKNGEDAENDSAVLKAKRSVLEHDFVIDSVLFAEDEV